jgi:thiamine-phosphate diphosphorylase
VHLVADVDVWDAWPAATERLGHLLAAGLPSVQFRAPALPHREFLRRAADLLVRVRGAGALFIVNGDLEAALALEADGLHLPARGPVPETVRRRLPAGMRLGVSCHDAAELSRAAGCDWVLLSPVFATRSKPSRRPLGTARLAELARESPAPVYALGGVDANNAASCFRAGVAGVAAIRALLGPRGEDLVRAARKVAEAPA